MPPVLLTVGLKSVSPRVPKKRSSKVKTATVFTIYANNSGGTGVAYLTITVLEPVATVVYVPENITLTRGEDNASIVPILGGGMVASWSISPELPEGMVFDLSLIHI